MKHFFLLLTSAFILSNCFCQCATWSGLTVASVLDNGADSACSATFTPLINNSQIQTDTTSCHPANYFSSLTLSGNLCINNAGTIIYNMSNQDQMDARDVFMRFDVSTQFGNITIGMQASTRSGSTRIFVGNSSQTNISGLTFSDMSIFRNYEISFNNGTVQFVVDNNIVGSMPYSSPICSIVSLSPAFKGRGFVDNIRIINSSFQQVYFDDFNTACQTSLNSPCNTGNLALSFTPPTCEENNLNLFSSINGNTAQSYSWTGPNGFTSNQANPVINNPTLSNAGTYTLQVQGSDCMSTVLTQNLDVTFEIPICTGCDMQCFWKTTGNTITNGENLFGTLSNDNIKIISASQDRGIITQTGSFGWNTQNPSTLFHIDCLSELEQPSAIRFENLQQINGGEILVIDESGYVYRSGINISHQFQEMQEQINQLKRELNNNRSNSATPSSLKIDILYQNVPNPTKSQTEIKFNLAKYQNAKVLISDLSGKIITTVNILPGTDKIIYNTKGMAKGLYLYTLINGDAIIDTKKMLVD